MALLVANCNYVLDFDCVVAESTMGWMGHDSTGWL